MADQCKQVSTRTRTHKLRPNSLCNRHMMQHNDALFKLTHQRHEYRPIPRHTFDVRHTVDIPTHLSSNKGHLCLSPKAFPYAKQRGSTMVHIYVHTGPAEWSQRCIICSMKMWKRATVLIEQLPPMRLVCSRNTLFCSPN